VCRPSALKCSNNGVLAHEGFSLKRQSFRDRLLI
jgi:hypothetical protein